MISDEDWVKAMNIAAKIGMNKAAKEAENTEWAAWYAICEITKEEYDWHEEFTARVKKEIENERPS